MTVRRSLTVCIAVSIAVGGTLALTPAAASAPAGFPDVDSCA